MAKQKIRGGKKRKATSGRTVGVDRKTHLSAIDVGRKTYVSAIDVAQLAGVSQSAVSRTFTEGRSVSERTRVKVMKAADELGYRPSVIPRIMLTRRSLLVGIVIGGMGNPYYAGVIDLLAKEIQKSGSSVLLFSVNQGESMDEVVPLISGYRVDGIVSALSMLSPEAASLFTKIRLPVVLLNGKIQNDWVSSVCCDNYGGGSAVADLFVRRGAKRFGYISGREGDLASEDRYAGYVDRLKERGVRAVTCALGHYTYEGGFEALLECMSREMRPDAVFCANDLMAIGAMEAARSKLSLRIPDDLLIAGFDDIPAAGWLSIGLTTVRQNAAKMVAEAVGLLQRRVENETRLMGPRRIVAVKLIERQTTRDGRV